MIPQKILSQIVAHKDVSYDDMLVFMHQVMRGEVSPVMVAAIITGLRLKKESVGEITAAAQAMRELATKVVVQDRRHLVDTCGTGGDAAHTFNISTTAAIVAAASGAQVAKHGGRSVSSKSGSADVLEALGINLAQTPEQVAASIHEVGLGLMFAPNYHSAMKFAAPVRKELGIRTLFNILGPLINPAAANNQVLGVFSSDLVGVLAQVLQRLGSHHVMVVNGQDGLDEIAISGATNIAELKHGKITEFVIKPEDFGLKTAPIEMIQVDNAEHAKAMLISVLENQVGPARDIVLLNAGAAIYVSGIADTLQRGIEKAYQAIETGAARKKLHELVIFSNQNS